MGMSLDDFCRCDFDEFIAIYEAWRTQEEEHMQGQWERMRTLAAIVIQPHCKKRITPRQLLPLPWDHKRPGHEREEPEHLTIEERRARAAEIVKRLGETTI